MKRTTITKLEDSRYTLIINFWFKHKYWIHTYDNNKKRFLLPFVPKCDLRRCFITLSFDIGMNLHFCYWDENLFTGVGNSRNGGKNDSEFNVFAIFSRGEWISLIYYLIFKKDSFLIAQYSLIKCLRSSSR